MPTLTITSLITNPTGIADVDGYGVPIYLDPGVTKIINLTSRQLDAMAVPLTTARKAGFISYTIAQNPAIDQRLDSLDVRPGMGPGAGVVRVQGLATPAAPTGVATGGTGTNYTYAVVAIDASGNKTVQGATVVVSGGATLGSTVFNTITWTPAVGAVAYDILRTASAGTPSTTGSLALAQAVTQANVLANSISFVDNGLAATAYTAAARNATGDLTVDGKCFVSAATPAVASIGQSAAMTAGTVTVACTAVTASSLIFLSHGGASAITNWGALGVSTITAGTSFVIKSGNAADIDTVNYWVIN